MNEIPVRQNLTPPCLNSSFHFNFSQLKLTLRNNYFFVLKHYGTGKIKKKKAKKKSAIHEPYMFKLANIT